MKIVGMLPAAMAQPEVVFVLEEWMARARLGKVRGFCIVAVMDDGTTAQQIEQGDCNQLVLFGALALQQWRLAQIIREDSVTKLADPPSEPVPEGNEGG